MWFDWKREACLAYLIFFIVYAVDDCVEISCEQIQVEERGTWALDHARNRDVNDEHGERVETEKHPDVSIVYDLNMSIVHELINLAAFPYEPAKRMIAK